MPISRAPSLQVDRWTSGACQRSRYQFDDDNAPERFAPLPPAATHSSEHPVHLRPAERTDPGPLDADQQALADSMRAAWSSFAADGDPSTPYSPGRRQPGEQVMSLVPPQPQVWAGFVRRTPLAFWAAG